MNLTYVPKECVSVEFINAVNRLKDCKIDNIDSLIEYFKANFIGHTNLERPIYDVIFWNCNDRVKENLPRTTNCAEAWHRNLNQKCHTPHLHLGKFLEILIQETEKIRMCLIHSKKSVTLSEKNLKKEEKIRTIVFNYQNYDGHDFFESLHDVVNWKFD